ncbi:DASH family cryptochrome [Marinagarivorans algicola]|uniref:DASH family cryptochrome n=1 Tax=Marinagarivorans algicola TaxID=1513270 RepID=UPI003736C836
MKKVGLYCFDNDLRVHDNPALLHASHSVDVLICVAIIDPKHISPNRYGLEGIGLHRKRFLKQSLVALNNQLLSMQQQLHVIIDHPMDAIAKLITLCDINVIYSTQHAGFYEKTYWQLLQKRYKSIHFRQYHGHTIFSPSQLPFDLPNVPASFSAFRKNIEKLKIPSPVQRVSYLPMQPTAHTSPALEGLTHLYREPFSVLNDQCNEGDGGFEGGEERALSHVQQYFSGQLPAGYKQVRNALDGWNNSTKLSAWLANGCLSPRTVIDKLKHYEATVDKNDSTYWIFFELLWREYFQWYSHSYGAKLFCFSGIKNQKPLTSFYAERFKKWCLGQTPYPIVNACMKQLNATGYMSNRGRQLVASCFVHELGLDWRYGAAYFERQLIDYDVAANWGNWQYLAGVGADPRGSRKFNLAKQAHMYDPEGVFIHKWHGETLGQPNLDSVDAADWPIQ